MSEAAGGNDAEATNIEKEDMTAVSESAAGDQPPGDDEEEVTAPTPAVVDNIAKASAETDATATADANTAKSDPTTNDVEKTNGNDEVLLSIGVNGGGSAEATNPGQENEVPTPSENNVNNETNSSSDIDLLGFSPAESTAVSKNAEDVFGDDAPLHNQSTSTEIGTVTAADSPDLLGLSQNEETPSNDDVQKQNPQEVANTMDFEPHPSPTEKKDDVGENIVADSNKESIPPLMDAANNQEGEGTNQSENEASDEGNTVVEEPTCPPVEQDNAKAAADSQKEDGPMTHVATPDNKETISESNGSSEETKASDSENANETKEIATKVEEQVIEAESPTDQSGGSEGNTVDATPQVEEIEKVENEVQDSAQPENNEETTSKPDGKSSAEQNDGAAEERTQEEEEWLSMGLGLGDALRQIVALTEDRDSVLAISHEKEASKVQLEALLADFQSRLESEMTRRAEVEAEVQQARKTMKSYEERLATYEKMEDDLAKAEANLVTMVSEKSKIELEVQKLREMRDESVQKETVLSNRLNEAKKKEANKSTAAGRLEADNENLRDELKNTKEELDSTSKAKAKLESNMEKLKAKAVERVKLAETALAEERELNEERKKKMKMFVETKADELREAKESASDMQKELEETRASLRSSRDREDAFHKELEAARLKHRELQRDMERMKRNSEQLHRMGNNLEQELEKSANETEEHKKKRMSAKHEIMQMVRTLDAERAVSAKLRESVKFTFTPKALSQQELLNECLRDFQVELERLAAKTGKTLLPSELDEQTHDAPSGTATPEINGSSKRSRKSRASKADMDTERLVSNLEQETQQVSKGIMALAGSVERMRSLLNEDMGCMTYFTNVLVGTGEARHQPLARAESSDMHGERQNSGQFV